MATEDVDFIPHPDFPDTNLHGELTATMGVGSAWTGMSMYIQDPREAVNVAIDHQRVMIGRAASGMGWPEKDAPPLDALIRVYVTNGLIGRFHASGVNPTTRSSLNWAGQRAQTVLSHLEEAWSISPGTRRETQHRRAQHLGHQLSTGAAHQGPVFRTPWTFLDALGVARPPDRPKRRGAPRREETARTKLARFICESHPAQKGWWIELFQFQAEGRLSNSRAAAKAISVHGDEKVEVRKNRKSGRWEGRVKQTSRS